MPGIMLNIYIFLRYLIDNNIESISSALQWKELRNRGVNYSRTS